MDPKDIRTLKILESIETGQAQSQRDLAKQLDVSLGLVNAFVKRLIQMGYFKATTIPKNRMRYILTPKGAMEKTRLTYEYIQYSFQFYRDARRHQKALFKTLYKDGVRKVVLYGAKEVAEIAYLSMREADIQVSGVVDESRKGKRFFEHHIGGEEKIRNSSFDRIVVADDAPRDEVQKLLDQLDIKDKQVVWVTEKI